MVLRQALRRRAARPALQAHDNSAGLHSGRGDGVPGRGGEAREGDRDAARGRRARADAHHGGAHDQEDVHQAQGPLET